MRAKGPPVKVTLKGYTYRSTVAVMGGKFMVSVSADIRKATGVKGGDKIMVDIEPDTEVRNVILPPDLKKALDKNTKAKKYFETLSFSKQKNHVTIIGQAKTGETRQRRIEKTINDLSSDNK